MIGNKKVLAIIPARGGSKGLPGKNIRKLGEKPLIAWTIEASLQTRYIDRTIVSTDCSKIAKVAKEYGANVPFIRPEWLSTDEASTVGVVAHVLESTEEHFDVIILLQPTSPFRNSELICEALEKYHESRAKSLVSVCESPKSPYWLFAREDDDTLIPVIRSEQQFTRRQELPKSYLLNGAIYILDVSLFLEEKKFIYDNSKSYLMDLESSIDIDSLLDFKLAQQIFAEK